MAIPRSPQAVVRRFEIVPRAFAFDRKGPQEAFASGISGLALLFGLFPFLTGCGGGRVTVSTNAFDFGSIAVNTRIKRTVVTITNTTATEVPLKPSLSGSIEGSLSRSGSCEQTLQAAASCSIVLTFAPMATGAETGELKLNLTGASAPADQSVQLSGTGVTLEPGEALVSSTNNPLVALYSYRPTSPGKVWIDFGPTVSYGFKTASRTPPADTGTASIYVAGMRANTTYHMRASVQLEDGTVLTDSDHTFSTTNFPANTLPVVTATATGTPQPGVELMTASLGTNSTYLQAYATDLAGNLIWAYDYPDRDANTIIQPIKLLPNGNFLVTTSYASQNLVDGVPTGELVDVREIDLAGNPVRDISLDQINSRLATAGFNLTVYDVHHDVEVLPNGHWILIASTIRDISGAGKVVGDVLIDLDPKLKPVWVWNEFDHLDVNRRPVSFPDWTHTNAVLYSPDDGNLLVSIRHQSWIVKVDYNNGAGTGNILWKLGEGGDFTLTNGVDPADWFYGQHLPAFFSSATAGVFSLAVMDNGFNRMVAPNTVCGSGTPCYTTVPILSIDENARTATFLFHDVLPSSQYSFWGGSTTRLANGDLEFDLCAEGANSEVDEVKITGDTSQTVWQLKTTGTNLYRATRLPSLYPGVQW